MISSSTRHHWRDARHTLSRVGPTGSHLKYSEVLHVPSYPPSHRLSPARIFDTGIPGWFGPPQFLLWEPGEVGSELRTPLPKSARGNSIESAWWINCLNATTRKRYSCLKRHHQLFVKAKCRVTRMGMAPVPPPTEKKTWGKGDDATVS